MSKRIKLKNDVQNARRGARCIARCSKGSEAEPWNNGEKVIQQSLGVGQTFAQFGTGTLSNGLYYWVLKDSDRVIKTGKVAIMK